MTTTCESVRELLVDYADAELSESQSAAVAGHVVDCPACGDELSRLQRSLAHARLVWNSPISIDGGFANCARSFGRRSARRGARSAWVATCAVAMLVAGTWWMRHRGSVDPVAPARPQPAESEVVEVPDFRRGAEGTADRAESDLLRLEAIVAREGQSARLAASADLLASSPSLVEYRDRANQYLAEEYGDSSSGRLARQKVRPASHSNNRGT